MLKYKKCAKEESSDVNGPAHKFIVILPIFIIT